MCCAQKQAHAGTAERTHSVLLLPRSLLIVQGQYYTDFLHGIEGVCGVVWHLLLAAICAKYDCSRTACCRHMSVQWLLTAPMVRRWGLHMAVWS